MLLQTRARTPPNLPERGREASPSQEAVEPGNDTPGSSHCASCAPFSDPVSECASRLPADTRWRVPGTRKGMYSLLRSPWKWPWTARTALAKREGLHTRGLRLACSLNHSSCLAPNWRVRIVAQCVAAVEFRRAPLPESVAGRDLFRHRCLNAPHRRWRLNRRDTSSAGLARAGAISASTYSDALQWRGRRWNNYNRSHITQVDLNLQRSYWTEAAMEAPDCELQHSTGFKKGALPATRWPAQPVCRCGPRFMARGDIRA